jgi:hypothetical protein
MRRWNRLSMALGFLLVELLASPEATSDFWLMIWITVATLAVFAFCYWFEDKLRKSGSRFLLWTFQALFAIAFAGALLLMFVRMIST